jgi:hypothetical protein
VGPAVGAEKKTGDGVEVEGAGVREMDEKSEAECIRSKGKGAPGMAVVAWWVAVTKE